MSQQSVLEKSTNYDEKDKSHSCLIEKCAK